jgi:hypothetical protein
MKTNKEQLSPNPLEFNTLGLQEHPGVFLYNTNFHHLPTKRIGKKWEFSFFSVNLTVFLFLNEKNCKTFGNHKIEKKILIYFYK